ncbi:F-box/WD repeat-containing protein 10 [Aplochiton taeniatus]
MQSNINSGISPVYAKVREVLVPLRDNKKQLSGDILAKGKRDWSFENVYAGVKTRPVQMEERNVYCGEFNVLILLEKEDLHRVVHYSGGNLVAMGSKDRAVRLLDVTSMKETSTVLQGHAGSVRAVVLCEERELVISASYDLTIRCWNLKTAVCFMIFPGHTDTITCLDLEGSRLVSGAKDCNVKVWDLDTGQCFQHLKFKHRKPIQCVKIIAPLVLSSCDRGQVKIWNLQTGVRLKKIDAHAGSVKCLYFDHTHILTGGADGQAKAWSTNWDFKKCLMSYHHPMEVLTLSLLFLRVITGGADGKIRIFNFLSGECLRVIKASSNQSPVTALFTCNNILLVHTTSSVQLYQFAEVEWDYSLTSEWEDMGELCGGGESKSSRPSKFPYAFIRAERMAQVGSTNRKIYHRDLGRADNPALSHHARSLSAPSMRRAQVSQQESLRPATWSELQGHRRSRAYIDLQPEFITEPPSAICPGRPVSGRSQDSQSRASQTPRSTTTCSTRDYSVTSKWSMSCSEKAVQDRVKKRGPHRSLTTDHLLLKVNASQKPQATDQAGLNRELNAGVRDAWRPPSPPAPAPFHALTKRAAASTPFPFKPTPRYEPPPTRQAFHGMTKTYVPLLSKPLELQTKNSPPSRAVHSTTPAPSLLRLQSGDSFRGQGLSYQQGMDNRAHPPASEFNPLDPLRERGFFRLLTDSQLENYVRAQSQSNKKEQPPAKTKSQNGPKETVRKTKVRVKPVPDDPREGQVYAPELGPDVYI